MEAPIPEGSNMELLVPLHFHGGIIKVFSFYDSA